MYVRILFRLKIKATKLFLQLHNCPSPFSVNSDSENLPQIFTTNLPDHDFLFCLLYSILCYKNPGSELIFSKKFLIRFRITKAGLPLTLIFIKGIGKNITHQIKKYFSPGINNKIFSITKPVKKQRIIFTNCFFVLFTCQSAFKSFLSRLIEPVAFDSILYQCLLSSSTM